MRAIGPTVARHWRGYAMGLSSVLLVTGVIGALQPPWHIANVSMLYLIAVLATATVAGSGAAIIASVAAFLAFNWFFVEPVHTLSVAEPSEWLVLILFLITSVITGQLAGAQRSRAIEAAAREREATLLYAVAHLLVGADLEPALRSVADQLREGLRLRAVVIELHTDAGEQRVASGDAEVVRRSISSIRTWMASPAARATSRGHRWIRIVPPTGGVADDHRVHVVPLRSGEQRVGALAVVRGDPAVESANDRLLTAVAAQIGNALERARLQERATQAEVLQRTDALKTTLLNAVSHDLRTPLASIIASAGSLRQQDVDWTDAERASFAADILDEATRLSRIVSNLLDLSRVESGTLRPDRGWYDLSALVDDVVGRMRPLAAAHDLRVLVPDDLPPVPLDYVEIDEVLSNLVENALRHTPAGTRVEIVARATDGHVIVEVSDNGPGIAAEALPHLFDRFSVVPRAKGGMGLGLAVARGLVEAHGGRITAQRRGGGGTVFTFTLPLEAPVPAVP
ncbi:MAG TPA: ATP-binding protein [Candidatus Limnocylindria bacterium]|jgi:two-component system sensor histidine kinase KdpD